MNIIGRSKNASPKIYIATVSIVGAVVLLLLNFKIFPEVLRIMANEDPAQAEAIKNQFSNGMVVIIALLFLFNFWFWKIDSRLKKEIKKFSIDLNIKPNDSVLQEKLEKLERKRKVYMTLVEPIFIIVLGAIIAFSAATIFIPIYRSVGIY